MGRLRVPAVVAAAAAAAVVHRQTWSVVADFALLNFRWVIRGLSVLWAVILGMFLERLASKVIRSYPERLSV